MSNIYLKVPSFEEMHYRQDWMKNLKTMSYNAGYDINLKGYNKENGTISKTKAEMITWYDNWINKDSDRYFAYIYDKNVEEPIGEIYYYLEDGIHSMGILIQDKYRGKGYSYLALIELERRAFEENNINELSDFIPIERTNAIKSFLKANFILTNKERKSIVFEKETISKQLLITKEMYYKKKKIGGNMDKTTCYSEFVIQSNGKMTKNGFISNPNSYFKPEEITKILKIIPHSTTTMNEARLIGKGKYPFSTWRGCKKEEPALDANIQVTAIVEDLKEKIPILLQIKKQYDVNFYITIVPSIYNEEAPYIQFDKKIIDFCFQTNTEIGVHLYIFDKIS